jgi:exonuclease SbcD
MRFFHLSDLHIGLKLMGRDLREDQEYIFDEIAEYAGRYEPNAIVIAGDIYDKSIPSAEAVDLFDRFVQSLTAAAPSAELMMISGNHDSGPRVNVFRSVLRRQKIHMIGMPPVNAEESIEKVTLTDEFGPVHFYLLPFVRPSMVRMITGSDENGNALSYDAAVRRMIEREEM